MSLGLYDGERCQRDSSPLALAPSLKAARTQEGTDLSGDLPAKRLHIGHRSPGRRQA